MKYLDEYRDPAIARKLAGELHAAVTRPWVIMEICGGQTHTILRYGLYSLLPPQLEVVHGPGCPVCVTPLEAVDRALEIAGRPGVIFTCYGDMLRVPGSRLDLFGARGTGADVRIVYSPLDALGIARANPEREVVFFAIGFETTAPAHALAVQQARSEGVKNFSMLVSHVLVPPAIRAILEAPGNRVQGFIAPGHVCSVDGFEAYEQISCEYRIPVVVGGFEPVDLLAAILELVCLLEGGRALTANQYVRSVRREGNRLARRATAQVFEPVDRKWRGIGAIPGSGLQFRPEYSQFDAELRFDTSGISPEEPAECISALILQGRAKPTDCAAFGVRCSPRAPLGAPMVSAEGACSAYYRYARQEARIA